MSKVMRFNMIPAGQPNPSANGLYVRHADYAALEAECKKLKSQLNMIVRQSMPLEEVPGLEGWSRVVETHKAIEQRNAALAERERLRELLYRKPGWIGGAWAEEIDAALSAKP